jgi:hypothetical protein
MKIHRIAMLAAAVLIAPVAAPAQQRVGAIHYSESSAKAIPATQSRTPQLAGKWDILSTDVGGDQYNTNGGVYLGPIEFTVDFTQSGTTLTQVAGNTFTSSACSANGTATVAGIIDQSGNSRNATVQFTAIVDNGYTYTFTGKYDKSNPSQVSGSWSTTGGACGGQNGEFTAYQYNQLTNNSYLGEFTSDINGKQVNGVNVNLKEGNDFSVSGSISGPASSCFNGLTVDPSQSFSSGGFAEFYAANNSGGIVAFSASNTDSNFQQLPNDQPNETSLYITYAVFQSGGNCQAGDSGHDAVFRLRLSPPVKRPIFPPHRP